MRGGIGVVYSYETWYGFRKELQRRTGVVLHNKLWLQIKPVGPLPWFEAQMKEAILRLSRNIVRSNHCPRCGGLLVLDKDLDGFHKTCLQCAFQVEVDELVVNELRTPPRIFSSKWSVLNTLAGHKN
jgi:hypothetical protein